MSILYKEILEEEINCGNIIMPEHMPVIYIDEQDNVYCYNGTVDKDRFLFESYPYYLAGQKPEEIKKYIKGYFRIYEGSILYDKIFINERTGFNNSLKCKIVPAYVHFPEPNDMSFGVYSKKYEKLEDDLTRKVFGLTYLELKGLIECYNKVFKAYPISTYSRYPSITRSIKNDNFCDINNYWIPERFPYIAFEESNYYLSHVSLGGFYQIIQFITLCNINSHTSKLLIENGLNPGILTNIFNIDNNVYDSIPLNRSICIELYD